MTTTGPTANAGWYPDPNDLARIRYWNGASWTEHTLEAPPQQATTWPPPQTSSTTSRTSSQKPWWRRWWTIAIAVLAVLMIIGSLSPDSNGDAKTPKAVTPTPSPVVSPKASKAKVQKAAVPLLRGVGLADARTALRAHHLKVGYIQRRPSALPPGTVLSQDLHVGRHVLYGSSVALVVAAPFPRVPAVRGLSQSAAASALRAVGFRVVVKQQTTTSGTNGVVLSQSPIGGSRIRPHSMVTIVLSHVVRPVVAAPPPSNCTPGYTPCLPPASDYDCSGGSGNGPKYTGLVRVTGSDPYDLDADGDGWGCE